MRRSARPAPVVGILVPIRSARQGRPTKSGRVRLPCITFERTPLEASDTRFQTTLFRAIDHIQPVCHLPTAVFREKVGQGRRVEAAPRYAQSLPEGFGRFEQFIWD